MSQYYTIQSPTEGFYKEKGSKFLAFAYPVVDDEEVRDRLNDLQKTYHDARHHCYAWILGLDNQIWRANDDGEPAHSAGDPILGQIRSAGLTNVLVVVVRYFGGTKLGVGGLIHAYKTAAEDALKKAKRDEVYEKVYIELKFSYDLVSAVERLVTDLNLEVVKREFLMDCLMTVNLNKDLLDTFRQKTKDLYNLQVSINA